MPPIVGDLDGDGRRDAVVYTWPSSASALSWVRGDGTGSFAPAQTIPFGGDVGFAIFTPYYLAFDISGDGADDLVRPTVSCSLPPESPPQLLRVWYGGDRLAEGVPIEPPPGTMNSYNLIAPTATATGTRACSIGLYNVGTSAGIREVGAVRFFSR